MIRRLRAAFRIVRLCVSTGVLYATYRIGLLLLPAARHNAWRNKLVRLWAAAVGRAIALRPSMSGERPTGRFILVSNHLSYVDILLLAQFVDVAFIAKSEVRDWPAVGTLAASTGTIFVDRNSRRDAVRVLGEMEAALDRGLSVALFPEGTSTNGRELLPFRSSLLDIAARSGERVVPVAIRYTTAPGAPDASDSVCWWGDTEFVAHFLALLRLPYIDGHARFGEAVQSRDRKELAQLLEADVRALLAT